MEKVKLEFVKSEPISIGEYGGQEVFVESYIPYEDFITICTQYLVTYFMTESIEELYDWNYLGAEQEMMLYILDGYTNIMVFDENDNLAVSWDGLIETGLMEDVLFSISNYEELRRDIYTLVENVKQKKAMDSSFKTVLDNVTSTLIKFAEGLSDIEMTEEGFGKIAKEISKIGDTIKDSPVSAILEDANRK